MVTREGSRYRVRTHEPPEEGDSNNSIEVPGYARAASRRRSENPISQVWSWLAIMNWSGNKGEWLGKTGKRSSDYQVVNIQGWLTRRSKSGSLYGQLVHKRNVNSREAAQVSKELGQALRLGSTHGKRNDLFVREVLQDPDIGAWVSTALRFTDLVCPWALLTAVTKEYYSLYYAVQGVLREITSLQKCSPPEAERRQKRIASVYSMVYVRMTPLYLYITAWCWFLGHALMPDSPLGPVTFMELWRKYILESLIRVRKKRKRQSNQRLHVQGGKLSDEQMADELLDPRLLLKRMKQVCKWPASYRQYRQEHKPPPMAPLQFPGPPPYALGGRVVGTAIVGWRKFIAQQLPISVRNALIGTRPRVSIRVYKLRETGRPGFIRPYPPYRPGNDRIEETVPYRECFIRKKRPSPQEVARRYPRGTRTPYHG